MRRNTTIRDRHRATIARAQPPCWLCGQPIDYSLKYPDPASYVVDHVVPLDAGGEDALSNKRAAHRICNSRKSNKQHAAGIIRRSGALARTQGEVPPAGGEPPFPA